MTEPLLTIGLVVRNGAAHIAQTIKSFQAQTFQSYRLIVYDNASSDDTQRIADDFASRDKRIRVVRHSNNMGVVANLVHAAQRIHTAYFCWAAHDDLREPRYLETLINLLVRHPECQLACSAVRNMDPDGTLRDVRSDTCALRTTIGMSSAQRLRMFLRDGPGTPFYGVFRSDSLVASLDSLAAIGNEANPTLTPPLGLDITFLAAFIRDHHIAYTPEPLLHFRRGGVSHRVNVYGSAREYFGQLRSFARRMRQATTMRQNSHRPPMAVNFALRKYLARYLLSRPMRRMTWHYLSKVIPRLEVAAHLWALSMNPAFRRLRKRFARLPPSRVAIFGTGRHTARTFGALQRAIGKRHTLIAICDDAPADAALDRSEWPVIDAEHMKWLKPDVVLVSSDAYEATLMRRAKGLAAAHTNVWCIYDTALETAARDSSASASSTPRMNSSISIRQSSGESSNADALETDLISSTNA